ncbi:MAG: hypothetical protein COT17_05615 [Elusimicrobia bacterium CG08_land_8_20_14_0_20_51_18]|nr:MAG: hypothetical protein COT17_05615 [Elusimicrobia bacterium CG08_land_8_20_14_0_20_51_18]
MEILIIVAIPIALLLLGGAFLVVGQTSSFLQSTYFNSRQRHSDMIIQQYMNNLILAQTQISRRSRELELLAGKLDLSNQELARLNDMKSKFLSMVVHDVRTPLSSIKGFSELMIKKTTDKKSAEYLKNISLASDQLGRLISDLTDLAMIEAGKLKMEKTRVHFPEIAWEILPAIRINAQKRGVELIEHQFPEEIYIDGDKFRLSQVLMNLLNNAIKFTPAGKRIDLSFRKEGRHIVTSVKDSGIGLHPSETKKIFEKFYQAKHQKDEKLRKQGWGLGLSIAQEIVHSHSGEIWAQSAGLGKGSTFSFKVPVD